MDAQVLLDAIDDHMWCTDSTAVDRAHIICAYHLLLLALWLEGRADREREYKAAMTLAFHALKAAHPYHTQVILGIAANQWSI